MNTRQRGFIAISMVILLVALVIAIATSVALLSIGEAESALTLTNGESTWDFVDGCAEDALQKIHDNPAYAGGTITRPEGTCNITINTGNPNWDITVTTADASYKRTVEIKATRGTTITITSWQEI